MDWNRIVIRLELEWNWVGNGLDLHWDWNAIRMGLGRDRYEIGPKIVMESGGNWLGTGVKYG